MGTRYTIYNQSIAIERKARYWREYLSQLRIELHKDEKFYLMRSTSLWVSTFSYIEWLSKFYYLKQDYPKVNDIAAILHEAWNWESEIGTIFWKAGRHQMAHTGQSNSFHSYYKYKGLPTNVQFDNNFWTLRVTKEWDSYHKYKAVAVLPPLAMGDTDVQIISFHHQMLVDDLLEVLCRMVTEKIKAIENDKSLRLLIRLNNEVPH